MAHSLLYSALSLPLETNEDSAGTLALKCPGCGHWEGTHVDTVAAETRHEDDDIREVCLNLIDGDIETSLTPHDTGRSPRRHSVSLGMFCELCDDVFEICFIQHKGTTFIEITRDTLEPS